jgi:GTP-binding protein Era
MSPPLSEASPAFRSGFVTVLGQPNAGKSTLVNALAGRKVAIVAAKPQTTRTTLQAIVNRPGAQIIFIDTPGIHAPKTRLHHRMMESVRGAARDQDLLLWLADALAAFETSSEGLDIVKSQETPALLVLNKIDRLRDKRQLLPLIDRYRQAGEFAGYFPVSAITGEGLADLEKAIVQRMPEGPQYFPPDQITDAPERFMASEIIREKVLHACGHEVPHSTAVLVEAWEDTPRLLRIGAAIHVERAGQKRIVIGSGGSMIKRIGTGARLELEERHGKKVHLQLFVKVKPKWRESEAFLNELDWRV